MFANENNKTRNEMDNRKKIEDILLNDYGCFDDFTVDKLCDLFSVSDCLMAKTKGALDVERERMTDRRLSAVQQAKSTGKFLAIKGIRDGVTNGYYNSL